MSSHIKVLKLDRWMTDINSPRIQTTLNKYIEIEPVFNRNGQYYCRYTQQWWFETCGRAFTSETGKQTFLWSFEGWNEHLLSKTESGLLSRICSTTSNKELKRMINKSLRQSWLAESIQRTSKTVLQTRLRWKRRKEMENG